MSAFLLLAGCVDQAADDERDEEAVGTPRPVAEHYMMTDCYEQAASFPVPAEEYVEILPDGFSIAPYTGGGSFDATPTSDQMGELFVVASQCTDPDAEAFQRAFTAVFVTPPEALSNPAATFGHLLVQGYWTSSGSHHDIWQAWGLQPIQETLSMDRTDLGPQRTGVAEFPSSGGVTLTTEVALADESLPANTARFFGANHGNITGIADAQFGALSVYLGTANVEGTPEVGIQSGPYDGAGFHAFGHSNHWTHVGAQT